MENAIVPYEQLNEMASRMAASGLFNKTPEQMLSLMLIAQAEGIHPAIAAQEYDIIQGRAALNGKSALARFQAAGGQIKYLVRTDAECKVWLFHPQAGEITVAWNMEKARKMGLADKDNYKKQPGTMFQWRALAEGIRALYPACLNRMYTSAEVEDMEPAEFRNVTPPPAEIAPPPPPEKTIDEMRAELARLMQSPDLYEAGKTAIADALAKPDTPAQVLADFIERAETRIAEAKAGKTKREKA